MKGTHGKRGLLLGIIMSLIWCNFMVCFAESGDETAKEEVIYYYDSEPLVADVYVRAEPFDRSKYHYSEWRELKCRDAEREGLTNVFIQWDWKSYDKNIEDGLLEFQIEGTFQPMYLEDEAYALWEKGLIQIEPSSQPKLNVHVRPPDFVTDYVLDEPQPFQKIVKPGTLFEDVTLPDMEKLLAVDSPYDEDVWFSIDWNKEQYDAGMASGETSFTMEGTYDISKREDALYKDLWEKGLLNPTPAPKITICGKPEKPMVYYPLESSNGLYTSVRPDTSFAQVATPQVDWLGLKAGNWADALEFQIVWNEEEYKKGIESGADRFEISGTYGPGLLGEEEKSWWEEGLIQIDPSTSPDKLVVQVVRETTLPFTISFRSDCPLFYFPTPHGATQVVGRFSLDGTTWYTEESWDDYGNDFSENSELWAYQYDAEDNVITVPQEKPSYYQMIVTGSAYEGTTKIIAINHGEGTAPGDEGDIDGNRGGGSQGESERVEDVLLPGDFRQTTGSAVDVVVVETIEAGEKVEKVLEATANREEWNTEEVRGLPLNLDRREISEAEKGVLQRDTKEKADMPWKSANLKSGVIDARESSDVKRESTANIVIIILGSIALIACGTLISYGYTKKRSVTRK